ncbi:MAG: hypothetical protein K9M36_01385, partial [Candidatus Pacebacteria bacterium]|nr:hypothetical protein [Candidatus Paceibacterota bacterium]
MPKENPRKQQPRRNGTSIGDVTPQEIKDAILRTSPKESVSENKKPPQEKAKKGPKKAPSPEIKGSPKSKENITIPKEITNLEPEDLVFYAGEQGYAEYFILHKDAIEDELIFTVQKGKRKFDGTFEETAREEIPATTFAKWFYQKSLVFSTQKENLTLKEETDRVIQNLENKKKYHVNNKDRNPEYQKTIAFMDQLIQEREESLPSNASEAKKNILSEMQTGLELQMPESPFAKEAIHHLDEMTTVKETFEGEQALQKIAELFADPKFSFPVIAT